MASSGGLQYPPATQGDGVGSRRIGTPSAEALLVRLLMKIDWLCAERDPLVDEARRRLRCVRKGKIRRAPNLKGICWRKLFRSCNTADDISSAKRESASLFVSARTRFYLRVELAEGATDDHDFNYAQGTAGIARRGQRSHLFMSDIMDSREQILIGLIVCVSAWLAVAGAMMAMFLHT